MTTPINLNAANNFSFNLMDGKILPLTVESVEASAAAISSQANRQNVKDKRRPAHKNSKPFASPQSTKANDSGQRGGGGGGNGGFGATVSGKDFRKVFF